MCAFNRAIFKNICYKNTKIWDSNKDKNALQFHYKLLNFYKFMCVLDAIELLGIKWILKEIKIAPL